MGSTRGEEDEKKSGDRKDLLLVEKTSEKETKNPEDVGDSR